MAAFLFALILGSNAFSFDSSISAKEGDFRWVYLKPSKAAQELYDVLQLPEQTDGEKLVKEYSSKENLLRISCSKSESYACRATLLRHEFPPRNRVYEFEFRGKLVLFINDVKSAGELYSALNVQPRLVKENLFEKMFITGDESLQLYCWNAVKAKIIPYMCAAVLRWTPGNYDRAN